MMTRLCQGKFSAETVGRIKQEVIESRTTFGGKVRDLQMQAESKHGEWLPKTHRAAVRRSSSPGKRMSK